MRSSKNPWSPKPLTSKKGVRKMKHFFRVGIVVLVIFGSAAQIFADIRQTSRDRGGPDLQNVYDRVLCVDGFKVFQTIVFSFAEDGGSAVCNIQLMEENNGVLVPVRCSD
jgi:hypothetical protein